jgi:RNA polymerase sigma-70 factor, ECF subfamily
MASRPQDPQENLIALITRHQAALHAYIFGLIPNRSKADDVLQETNLVLWRKGSDYDHSLPFMPWACGIARFQVKAANRDAARDRHVFDPQLLDLLAIEDEPGPEATAAMEHALSECLEQLPGDKRNLILHRYHPGSSVHEMAASRKVSPGALSVQLHRIRQTLEQCVEGKLTRKPS